MDEKRLPRGIQNFMDLKVWFHLNHIDQILRHWWKFSFSASILSVIAGNVWKVASFEPRKWLVGMWKLWLVCLKNSTAWLLLSSTLSWEGMGWVNCLCALQRERVWGQSSIYCKVMDGVVCVEALYKLLKKYKNHSKHWKLDLNDVIYKIGSSSKPWAWMLCILGMMVRNQPFIKVVMEWFLNEKCLVPFKRCSDQEFLSQNTFLTITLLSIFSREPF